MISVDHTTEPFKPDDNTTLLGYSWMPKNKEPRAICIAIHGGMAYAGDWGILAPSFVQKRVAIKALDLRYHGTFNHYNPGQKVYFHIQSYEQYVYDIHRYYLKIRNEHPKTPIFILGHSNGGLIALYYGLTKAPLDINGFLISSPWLKNKVPVSKYLLGMMHILALANPKFTVTPESFSHKVTHDKEIMKTQKMELKKGLRGTMTTVKLGVESLKTQRYVIEHIKEWKHYPIWAVLAGDDFVADVMVSQETLYKLPKKILTLEYYENNYHENFNELNREVIFKNMLKWINAHLKSRPII